MKTLRMIILVALVSFINVSFSFACDTGCDTFVFSVATDEVQLNKQIVVAFFEAKDYKGLAQYLDRFPSDPRTKILKQLVGLIKEEVVVSEDEKIFVAQLEALKHSVSTRRTFKKFFVRELEDDSMTETGWSDETGLAEMHANMLDSFKMFEEAKLELTEALEETRALFEEISAPIKE